MDTFRERVQMTVRTIPYGKVMSYGQIAALCGNARAARIVGGIAHYGDPTLPWHRVVNKAGRLASGYPGGRRAHRLHLENENVGFMQSEGEYYVDMDTYLWQP